MRILQERLHLSLIHISMPGMDSECRVVRVSGDSMAPVINNGDYIAVREVGDLSLIHICSADWGWQTASNDEFSNCRANAFHMTRFSV